MEKPNFQRDSLFCQTAYKKFSHEAFPEKNSSAGNFPLRFQEATEPQQRVKNTAGCLATILHA